ncbi:GCN5-related N-acetyltransferas-like protein [Delitschia confertaspora ATCC 74209]|uniref:GCN5-related N-acetyltransferas-like protein n=1 Tax=Delitschia confertaspora ATCC 74209 TaxID=1513339 RepID=A0A9P4MTX1_9PLEO|nr:GCN5-related N-acetyltransferas-like protein [Delitschia confertaspora ATCC 74209]
MSSPFIRPYNAAHDFSAAIHIFNQTAHSAIQFEPALTIGSHIYCRPYLLLCPSTCLVLDSGTGQAVGYIIGTVSTAEFVKQYQEEFIPGLDPRAVPRPTDEEGKSPDDVVVTEMKKAAYDPEGALLHRGTPQLLERYPAHLHIDILPEYQRRGFGMQMIEQFVETLKMHGARGVHLGLVATNTGARRFYERLGFRVFDEVMDGGRSGEVGREGDSLYMTKEL